MQQHKVNISKKKFRIGDLAKELKIKKYIIRFWEKEFDLESDRSDGGQRFYTQEDFDVFSKIKELLYAQGYTISGAKKQLTLKEPKMIPIQEKEHEQIHYTQPENIQENISKETEKITQEALSQEAFSFDASQEIIGPDVSTEQQEKTIIGARKEETPVDNLKDTRLTQQLNLLKEQLIDFKKLLE